MKVLNMFLILVGVIAIFILGFDWLTTSKAPLPDGGSATMDFSSFYGPADQVFKFLKPYAVGGLILAATGTLYSNIKLRSSC